MIRIAICDDDKKELEQTSEQIKAYLKHHNISNVHVEMFDNGDALLTYINENNRFDIYILDIIMPEIGGIEIAHTLRNSGDRGEIIYLTSSNDYAADSYDVRAFFYLLKPVNEQKLFNVLDGVIEKLKIRQNSAIVVSTASGLQRILMDDIRYVERVGRYIRYYCTNGIIESHTIRNPFREVLAPLIEDKRFYLCGASFVMNFQHVAGVNGQTALLDNGQTVSLPRTAATEFKKAWGSYWLEEQ